MMIPFPKDHPVIENLNSYYVDIQKVIEHYQGQIASGAVYFKAPVMEGVVFFDEDEPLSGLVETRDGPVRGEAAVAHLIEAADRVNFTLSVFEIPPEKVFFWMRLPKAQPVFDNLSAEFTDLKGLVKKMQSENLTGFIDVRGPGDSFSGTILFENGQVLDVCGPAGGPDTAAAADRLKELVAASRNGGASFSVRRIVAETAPAGGTMTQSAEKKRSFEMLEELIDIFERAAAALGKDFESFFRKACIQNAEVFDFLDPFVGEFSYSDKRITFTGEAEQEALTRGLLAALKDVARELNISAQIRHALRAWERRWQSRLGRYHIDL